MAVSVGVAVGVGVSVGVGAVGVGGMGVSVGVGTGVGVSGRCWNWSVSWRRCWSEGRCGFGTRRIGWHGSRCVAVTVNVAVTVKVGVRVTLGRWVVIFAAVPRYGLCIGSNRFYFWLARFDDCRSRFVVRSTRDHQCERSAEHDCEREKGARAAPKSRICARTPSLKVNDFPYDESTLHSSPIQSVVKTMKHSDQI